MTLCEVTNGVSGKGFTCFGMLGLPKIRNCILYQLKGPQ